MNRKTKKNLLSNLVSYLLFIFIDSFDLFEIISIVWDCKNNEETALIPKIQIINIDHRSGKQHENRADRQE